MSYTHLRIPAIRTAVLSAALALCFTAGCVYRIDIQQGNFLEDKEIDRVAVGMTRVQVRSLLGTPMVSDPFESSRWDYVYYLKRGYSDNIERRNFIVFFDGDKVTRIQRSNQGQPAQDQPAQDQATVSQNTTEEPKPAAE